MPGSREDAAELLFYTPGCVKQNDGVMLIIFISLESYVGIKIQILRRFVQ